MTEILQKVSVLSEEQAHKTWCGSSSFQDLRKLPQVFPVLHPSGLEGDVAWAACGHPSSCSSLCCSTVGWGAHRAPSSLFAGSSTSAHSASGPAHPISLLIQNFPGGNDHKKLFPVSFNKCEPERICLGTGWRRTSVKLTGKSIQDKLSQLLPPPLCRPR